MILFTRGNVCVTPKILLSPNKLDTKIANFEYVVWFLQGSCGQTQRKRSRMRAKQRDEDETCELENGCRLRYTWSTKRLKFTVESAASDVVPIGIYLHNNDSSVSDHMSPTNFSKFGIHLYHVHDESTIGIAVNEYLSITTNILISSMRDCLQVSQTSDAVRSGENQTELDQCITKWLKMHKSHGWRWWMFITTQNADSKSSYQSVTPAYSQWPCVNVNAMWRLVNLLR